MSRKSRGGQEGARTTPTPYFTIQRTPRLSQRGFVWESLFPFRHRISSITKTTASSFHRHSCDIHKCSIDGWVRRYGYNSHRSTIRPHITTREDHILRSQTPPSPSSSPQRARCQTTLLAPFPTQYPTPSDCCPINGRS